MSQDILPLLEKSRDSIKLPSLSQNIQVLLSALADENIDYRQLAEIISQYPQISARLISLANSAWSAPIRPISSIEVVCSRLGTSVVKSVCIALAVSSHFNPAHCLEFDVVRFWTDCLLVADATHLLALRLQNDPRYFDLKQSAQTAGLLHSMGLLWFAEYSPKETGNALRMALTEADLTISEALVKCCGADYCMVGGWVGKQWKIPVLLTTAMERHLQVDYQDQFWEMALLVGAAAAMVANLNINSEDFPGNPRLEKTFGLNLSSQQEIYKKLSGKFQKTQELARTLFS